MTQWASPLQLASLLDHQLMFISINGSRLINNHHPAETCSLLVDHPSWCRRIPTIIYPGCNLTNLFLPLLQSILSSLPFSVKSASSSISSAIVCSPTAQLLTPALMAVLNPNAQLADQQYQMQVADFEIPQGSAIHTARPTVICPGIPDFPLWEKKHACTMCHKQQVLIFKKTLCSS